MLRGLTTVTYFVADHAAAKRWYTELLGVEAYFDRPGYAEFRIGDYQHELGLIDSSYAPHDTTGDASGVIAYWRVDDVTAALGRLIELGATEHEGIRERGSGFITASVVDPFGNILGVMQNPHYLEVLAAR
ncbi:MAG TPA: VOC family protein [Actinopolymorphaceae bacterium]|jgi:predicted enzyme related to lactoylglutathione lyase